MHTNLCLLTREERREAMTALECLKILRKVFFILIIWNLLLTGFLIGVWNDVQQQAQNEIICNLEAIPQFEIVEVE